MLRGIVHTEYDLRARLEDWIAAGNSPKDWSKEIGLLLPVGARPTRAAVIKAVSNFNTSGGWHQLRMPSLEPDDLAFNTNLVKDLGILQAQRIDFGRLHHRTLEIDSSDVYENLLRKWKWNGFSPGWEHEDILQLFESLGPKNVTGKPVKVKVILMQYENEDKAREREWRADTGFINLFQGQDAQYLDSSTPNRYPGDRKVPILQDGESSLAVQIHRVLPKVLNVPELFTLAVHLGDSKIVRGRAQ
jgi:hypothetical protein